MARFNPRRRVDQAAAEVTRILAERRDAVLLTDAAINQSATVTTSDVDSAVTLWRTANDGTEVERLLDGPPGEDERP